MQRFRIPIVPYIEQLPYTLVTTMERLIDQGRLAPLGMSLLVTYLFLIFRKR